MVRVDGERAGAAAAVLWAAWTAHERIDALPAACRPRDAAEGFAVQETLGDFAGARYGWKLAATSAAGQAHIAVDGPLPGPLFDRFRRAPGDVLPSAQLHMAVVEAEFAFRMNADVPPGADRAAVLDAVAAVHLAIEAPESRFARFEQAGAAHLIADAACAGLFVLGPEVPGWRAVDLAAWPTSLHVNGVEVGRGRGANALGDPRTALAWLAAELPRFGRTLRAGEIVTTGTTTVPAPVRAGDRVRAGFGDLGTVETVFAR